MGQSVDKMGATRRLFEDGVEHLEWFKLNDPQARQGRHLNDSDPRGCGAQCRVARVLCLVCVQEMEYYSQAVAEDPTKMDKPLPQEITRRSVESHFQAKSSTLFPPSLADRRVLAASVAHVDPACAFMWWTVLQQTPVPQDGAPGRPGPTELALNRVLGHAHHLHHHVLAPHVHPLHRAVPVPMGESW